MDFKITKQLLNFLLRFLCPKCEFSTIDPILIQEHLFQCLKPRKIDITDSVLEHSEVEESMLDIKKELIETDQVPKKIPIVIRIKANKPLRHDDLGKAKKNEKDEKIGKVRKKHEKTFPLNCTKCHSLLDNLDNFKLHMNHHLSDDECCPVCELLINSKRFNFRQHLMIHTNEKPFNCKVCYRSFRQKSHLVTHAMKHRRK